MRSEDLARAETNCARAHKAVWRLWLATESLGLEGASADLQSVLSLLETIQRDLLYRGGMRRLRRPSAGAAERQATDPAGSR